MGKQHLLVVGAGSVGKRHLRNFARLGCQVSAIDPRADRLDEAAGEVELFQRFASLEDALSTEMKSWTAIVIATPTSFHVDQSIAALEAGLPVFLEKPVATDAASAARLVAAVQRTGVPLLLGYSYRWWPPIQDLKQHLAEQTIGPIRHVQCVMSAHLADWHPWERYQDFFMSIQALGGGALLDESHFLDLILWFFGLPTRVFARVERLSSLEIETDDNVDAWLEYPDGLRVMLHLDLYGRPHERGMTFRGEAGTLHWSYDRLRLGADAQPTWQETVTTYERNEMFLGAAREFVQMLETGQPPSCTINDGYNVMRVIDTMRQSSATGQVVAMAEAE